MHKARAFFYACAGLFLLALSYHVGARNAGAQQGSIVTGVFGSGASGGGNPTADVFVFTQNGDVYGRYLSPTGAGGQLVYLGNFWSGGPTPAQRESFGAMKSRYRGERGAAQPAPER